jgi:glycerol-3-phosphate dehydrogenase
MIETDVIIVGAGLMGAAIARELSKYQLKTAVVEKGADVCSGSSKATSAIIHSCYHENPGTLKAKLGVLGNALFSEICEQLDVPFKRIGSLLTAVNDADLKILEFKKNQGEANGVKGMRLIGPAELKVMEPHISSAVSAALYAPSCGIVNPIEFVIAMMENACENGVKLFTESPVTGIEKVAGDWIVVTPKGRIKAKYVINAAGIFADEIAALVGDHSFVITPFKGEEYLFDRDFGYLANHVIETASLGVIALPTVHGNLMIGTTRVKAGKDDFNTTREGFDTTFKNIRQMFPEISAKGMITSFAGLRAINNVTDDFIIEASRKADNFINVSIGSPGVFATPAVAGMTVEILENSGVKLKQKDNFNPYRKAIVDFKALAKEEQEEWIRKDRKYGHVVCRCETITEGQIVEAIKRGARTVDGIKYRTRAGMGRCQGGFCGPKVLKILARELGVSVTEITKKGGRSVIVPLKTKTLLKEIAK